ncbi:hypothetical protein [Streptococcus moroccensis]|uniref:MORN repeat protein n=1 Tax=Streptococcus moroccensis TaxID=1451356 RepID=A0ABT9YNI9_9STRE|nr:hypothetical protein [Streptococcus moroccensis]MDQ0221561.1 hypothetical protein [Streptococcus moroccensis]
MELIQYYYERIKPHLHRRTFEIAAVGLIVLCGLFVLLLSFPKTVKTSYNDGAIVYEGQVVRQKMTGQGKMTFANGDTYEGDFSNGTFQGKGMFRAKSGWSYEGEFVNGLAHGKGKLTTENGVVYEGVFEKGAYQDAN